MIILFMGVVVLGLVALQTYMYKKFWDKGLLLDLRFSAKEAFEGDSLILHEMLTNNKILPLPWIFVKFKLSKNLIFLKDTADEGCALTGYDANYQSDLFSIMMYRSIKRKFTFVCAKRGFYGISNLSMVCSNLLHNNRFSKNLKSSAELTVFPKILDIDNDIDIIYKNLDATILSNSLINPDPFEFRGIREYQPTDPMRDINFKATAQAQQLMVNIHTPTSSKRLEIILNTEFDRLHPDFEIYEQAIRFAATVAKKYIAQGVKVGMYTNGRDAATGENMRLPGGEGPSQLYKIFQVLARIELNYWTGPMAPHLNDLSDDGESPVHLIISPHHDKEFIDAVMAMKDRGMLVYMVVPVHKGADIAITENVDIKIWEAL